MTLKYKNHQTRRIMGICVVCGREISKRNTLCYDIECRRIRVNQLVKQSRINKINKLGIGEVKQQEKLKRMERFNCGGELYRIKHRLSVKKAREKNKEYYKKYSRNQKIKTFGSIHNYSKYTYQKFIVPKENQRRVNKGLPLVGVNPNSLGEIEVFNYLKEILKGYSILRNKQWKVVNNILVNCGYKEKGFELDFYIPELKLAIEFDGIHHYNDTRYTNKSIIYASDIQKKDKYVEDQLKIIGINLIRFSYKDNLELTKVKDAILKCGIILNKNIQLSLENFN